MLVEATTGLVEATQGLVEATLLGAGRTTELVEATHSLTLKKARLCM